MNTVIRELNFHLNTAARDNPSTTSKSLPTWSLDTPFTSRSPQNYFQICVRSLSVPANAWYDIVGSYLVTINFGISNVHYVPYGNYTVDQLVTFINGTFTNKATLSVATYQPNTMTLTVASSKEVQISNDLCELLGLKGAPSSDPNFPDSQYFSHTAIADGIYNGVKPYNLQPSRSLMVNCSVGTLDNFGFIQKDVNENRCICRVGLTSGLGAGSAINYEAQNLVYSTVASSTISYIGISLATERFGFLEMNLDYTITISITELVRPPQMEASIPQPVTLPLLDAEDDTALIDLARRVKDLRLKRKSQKGDSEIKSE